MVIIKKFLSVVLLLACLLLALSITFSGIFLFVEEEKWIYMFTSAAAVSYGLLLGAILRGVIKNVFSHYFHVFMAAIIFIPILYYGIVNELGSVYFLLLTIFTISMYIQCRCEIRDRKKIKEAC